MSDVSPWFVAHREAVALAAQRGPIVDLACGRGRHSLACAAQGLATVGIDRNAGFLAAQREAATSDGAPCPALVRADLEAGHAIPLVDGAAGVVLVFRYLHRPLAPEIERILAPGGLLLYETFTHAQADLPGGPSRAAFLLADDELPGLFPGLECLAHEQALRGTPAMTEAVASLAARRPA